MGITTARSRSRTRTAPTSRRSTAPSLNCVFTAEEGGAEHISLDHLPHARDFVADWVAETFAEQPQVTSRLDGNVVLITGTAEVHGRAAALLLAAEGPMFG